MGNHEYCEDCGQSDFHNRQPCNPIHVAKYLKITLEMAAKKRQCQPLDKQPSYREPK